MLKVGLIGINGFGKIHVANILKQAAKGKVKCVAFADVKVDKEDKDYQELIALGARHYTDYNEMLDNHRDLDFVTMATPIHLHTPMAVNALNKGFNVFLEKPPAVTIQDIDEIIQAAERSGKFCEVDFQNTSGKAFKTLIEKLKAGVLGDIEKVVGVGIWKRTQDYYERTPWAGKLIHNGSYVLDGSMNNPLAHLLNNCLIAAGRGDTNAAMPQTVQAELYKGHEIEGEDTTCVRINTVNDVEVLFYTTLCHTGNDTPYIKVYGSKGQAYWDYNNILEIKFNDGDKESYQFEEEDLFEKMLVNFVKVLKDKKAKLNSSISSCRSFVLASNGAFESCGKTIKIPQDYLIIKPEGDTVATYIKDIEKIIEKAAEEGKMFSEMSIEWAVPTQPFSMEDYRSFELFKDKF
ncbi:MAG: Gfo/Idh/MocA family oxidoreductase [Caldicoprobacterales bacterium]